MTAETQFRLSGRIRPGALLMLSVLVSGCSDQQELTQEPSRGELEQMVSGPAATGLDAHGKFQLDQPSAPDANQLSREQALALANAWPRQFGTYFRATLERGHGGTVHVGELRACGTPLFASSAYLTPPGDIPVRFTRPFGSWWLVGLCNSNDEIEASLAIAATATDVWLENGVIRFPNHSGNEFVPAGVPRGWRGPVAATPEAAVSAAYPHTRRRITSIPQLIAPSPDQALPQSATWRLVLESPTRLKEKGTAAQRDEVIEVYVGPGRFMGTQESGGVDANIMSSSQPDSLAFEYLTGDDPQSPRATGFVHRKPALPVRLAPTVPLP